MSLSVTLKMSSGSGVLFERWIRPTSTRAPMTAYSSAFESAVAGLPGRCRATSLPKNRYMWAFLKG